MKYALYFLSLISCYYLTGSKTTFITMIVVFIALVIIERFDKCNKEILSFIKFLFPMVFCFYFLLTYFYSQGSSSGILANNALNNRLKFTSMIMKKENITLFGQLVNYNLVNNSDYFYLDSMCSYLVYELGTVWFIVISVLLFKTSSRDTRNILLLLFLSLVSISEHAGINFVFVCSCLIFKNFLRRS